MSPHLSFPLVIGIALLHAFGGKIPLLQKIPCHYWVSGAGGAAISYIFLEVLPHLGKIQHKVDASMLSSFLENHIYMVALLGLVFFNGLDKFAEEHGHQEQHHNSLFFWVHIGSFAVTNAILGYLLQNSVSHKTWLGTLMLFIAISLHFLVIDHGLRSHHATAYDRLGRWILVGAIITGAVIRFSSIVNELLISTLWSFMAGGIILNVMKEEIPRGKNTSFGIFALTALIYSLILVIGLSE